MSYRNVDRPDYDRQALHNQDRLRLRRAAVFNMAGARALDAEDLLGAAAGGDQTARGNVVKRRLVMRALLTLGIEAGEIATAWHLTDDEVYADLRAPLLDESGVAQAIEQELAKLYPDVAAGVSLADRLGRPSSAQP